MKNIDVKWLRRLQDHISTLDRGCGLTSFCQKEIFVNRYFKFLENKCFKIEYQGEIHYCYFTRRTISYSNEKVSAYNYGIRFKVGWSNAKYSLTFLNEKGKYKQLELHYNDFLELKYEEISIKKYGKILKLFV